MSLVVFCLGWDEAHGGQITVVFRFDDYSAHSNTALEIRLLDVFTRSGVCCTFGVIPYAFNAGQNPGRDVAPLPVEKAAILREAMGRGSVDVAMHSYSHRWTGRWTEFAGLAYDEQARRVRQGRDLLGALLGTRVTTFIPAHNTYDRTTLQVLREAGFQCLAAGRGGPTDASPANALKFLPSVCGLAELRDAVQWARQSQDASPIIVVLFHAYDFREGDAVLGRWSLAEFENLLTWTVSQKDVTIQSIAQLLATEADLSLRRFEDNRVLIRWPIWAPPIGLRLLGFRTPPVYLSSPTIQQQRDNWRNATILAYLDAVLFYVAVAFAAALVALRLEAAVLRRLGGTAAAVSRYVAVAPVLAAVGLTLRDDVFGYRLALLLSVSLGLCLGVYLGLFRRKRARG